MVASTVRRRSIVYTLLVFVSTGTVVVNLLPQQSDYYRALTDSWNDGQGVLRGGGVSKADPAQMNDGTQSLKRESLALDRLRAPSDRCFYAEDLCVGSNRLYYRIDKTKHQPKFDLNLYYEDPMDKRHEGYHSNYSSFHIRANETKNMGCVDSKTPLHVILFSAFSDMLGEFYTRSLVGLFQLLNAQNVSVEDFAQHSQLYLHRMNFHQPLMDSHHLFTNALRSSPLQDMMQLVDSTQCQCLPRVLFCGYRAEPQVDSNKETRVQLTPSEGLFMDGLEEHLPVYSQMRNFLRSKLILDSPFALADIQQYRHKVLQQRVVPPNNTTRDYKIVGLAQRSSRRKWRNLDQVLQTLSEPMLEQGIILLEVNLDAKSWTPYQQMIRHAALDGLVGIHGAQLTQAIWMNPGSLVAELLPYIPDEIMYGQWTRETVRATPLGVIFDETDVVHIGYSLGRDSAPYCYNETLNCWTGDVHPWDDRDFLLSAEDVSMLLDMFVVNRPTTCDQYNETMVETPELVVYSTPCVKAPTLNSSTVRHFYRPRIKTHVSV